MNTKLYILSASILIAFNTKAQSPNDALKYSFTQQGGTARNLATGGAMASLGGEFSTLFINPAGLGMYRTKEVVITQQYAFSDYKNAFRGNNSNSDLNRYKFGNIGVIIGSGDVEHNNKRTNYAFGFGLNKTADFNNYITYDGLNNYSSYSEKYLEELIKTGTKDPNIGAYQFPTSSSLAINTYLVDPVYQGNSVVGYKSYADTALSRGLLQKQVINTKGGTYDLALGGAVNYEDKLYFGGSASLVFTHYKRNNSFTESEATPIANNKFNSFTVSDDTKVNGGGFNFKLGAIYKPTEQVRLGLAIHSPTFFNLTETQNVTVETDTENYQGKQKQSTKDVLDYQRSSLGLNVTDQSKYNFNTPWRVMLSGSYVFREVENTKKQRAFITADVEYLNYKNVSYSADDPKDIAYDNYLKSLKKVSKTTYKGAFNARLGAELKLNVFMLRAGLAYYGNPMKDSKNLKVNQFNLSGGLGYRNKGFFIDATYVHAMGKNVDMPYQLQDKANTFANIKSTTGQAVLTFGMKF